MATAIRGDKSHVRILKDGQPVDWQEITNIQDGETSQYIEDHYCGRKKPEVDVLMMGYEGTINGLVKNANIDILMQEIRDARKSGVSLPQINIVYVEQYDDAPSRTFLFTDVQLIFSNRTGAGANEKVTKTVSFKASDKRVL